MRALIVILFSTLAVSADAQTRHPLVLDLEAGSYGFADDGIVQEGHFGVGVRWYLTPRVSVGPEVNLVGGESHGHQILTGNLTFDFRGPGADGRPRFTPYVVAGGGLFNTRDQFGAQTFSHTEGAFTGGGGVKAPVGDRVVVGGDVRMGWEPHFRLTGFVGVRLGS